MTKTKKFSRFWLFLIIYLIIIIIAIFVSLGVLYNFLAEYERTLPTGFAEKFMDNLDYNYILNLILADHELLENKSNGFEDIENIAAIIAEQISCEFTLAQDMRNSTESNPVFLIKSDNIPVCSVRLTAGTQGKLGLFEWDIDSVILLTEYLPNPEYSAIISAPEKIDIYLNKIKLDNNYIANYS